jgi:hypothetical protein
MRHDLDIYISSRISGLEENGAFRGLDKFSAAERFSAFLSLGPALGLMGWGLIAWGRAPSPVQAEQSSAAPSIPTEQSGAPGSRPFCGMCRPMTSFTKRLDTSFTLSRELKLARECKSRCPGRRWTFENSGFVNRWLTDDVP